jgi:hypothetical protein
VFDGRRRYNITFTYLKDEQAKLTTGAYKGKAHLCQMHYNQIAGFKPKIMKEGKAFPPIYGWFADIPSASAPNGRYLIALRVWASTGYGTVMAELNQLKIDGDSGASPERVTPKEVTRASEWAKVRRRRHRSRDRMAQDDLPAYSNSRRSIRTSTRTRTRFSIACAANAPCGATRLRAPSS